MEWYDFYLYGTAAALVLGPLYFPAVSPASATMAALATFGVGFIARPLGALVFGRLGDRYGRRTALVATMLVMGVSTVLMGLLPTHAQIGLWAPVLLVALRVVQGLAVGGEWGNAVVLVVEHAPPAHRALYGSSPQIGAALGLVLSTAAFSVTTRLSGTEFHVWGWRIPFLLSVVVVIVALVIRIRVPESPVFQRQPDPAYTSASAGPIESGHHGRNVALAAGAFICPPTVFYVVTVFGLAHATTNSGVARHTYLDAVLAAAAIECVTLPVFGWLADRAGRRPVYAFGLLVTALWAVPAIRLLDTGRTPQIYLAVIVAVSIGHAAQYAPAAAFFAELFRAPRRSSGACLGYQIGAAIGGGGSPLLAAWLVANTGGTRWPPAAVLIGAALVSAACVAVARETANTDLDRVDAS